MEYTRVNEMEILLCKHDAIQGIIDSLKVQLEAVAAESEESVIQSMILSHRLDGQPAAMGNVTDKTGNTAFNSKSKDVKAGVKEICKDLILLEKTQQKIDIALRILRPQERTIIELRCFQGLTWQQVCDKSLFSDSHTRRIMKEAVSKLTTVSKIELNDYNQIKKLLY